MQWCGFWNWCWGQALDHEVADVLGCIPNLRHGEVWKKCQEPLLPAIPAAEAAEQSIMPPFRTGDLAGSQDCLNLGQIQTTKFQALGKVSCHEVLVFIPKYEVEAEVGFFKAARICHAGGPWRAGGCCRSPVRDGQDPKWHLVKT